MEFQQIHVLLWCTAGVMALTVFSGILLLALRKVPQAVATNLYDKISVKLSGSRNSIFDYAKREAFLVRSGAAYHYGKWVEPVKYLAMQILLAGAGMLVGGYYHVLLGIVAAIVLFGLPDYLLIILNKKE
jgi:hypothetical protein